MIKLLFINEYSDISDAIKYYNKFGHNFIYSWDVGYFIIKCSACGIRITADYANKRELGYNFYITNNIYNYSENRIFSCDEFKIKSIIE